MRFGNWKTTLKCRLRFFILIFLISIIYSNATWWCRKVWKGKKVSEERICSTSDFIGKFKFGTSLWYGTYWTLKTRSFSESCIEIKIKLNFYFHTSLWCLKKFYEGLHKTFWGTTKKCENKNLNWFFHFVQDWDVKG